MIIGFREISGRNYSGQEEQHGWVRKFLAKTDNPADGPAVVLLWPGVPRKYSWYVDSSGIIDTTAWCKSVEIEEGDDPYHWIVTANYDSKLKERPDLPEPPLERPAEFSLSFEEQRTPLLYDLDSLPFVNSAGQAFDPPIETSRYFPVLTIKKSFASVDLFASMQVVGAINSDTFLNAPAGTLKIKDLQLGEKHDNGITYWEANCQIIFKSDTWYVYVLDQGFMELDENGKLSVMTDETGATYNSPRLLDGTGHKLGEGGSPVYLGPYRVNTLVDFNGLNLL